MKKIVKVALCVAGAGAIGTGGYFGIKAMKKHKAKRKTNANGVYISKNCKKGKRVPPITPRVDEGNMNDIVLKEEIIEPTPDELKEFQEVLSGLKEPNIDDVTSAQRTADELRVVKNEVMAVTPLDDDMSDEELVETSTMIKEIMDDISVGSIHTITLSEYNDVNGFDKKDYQLFSDGVVVTDEMTGEYMEDVADELGVDFPYECDIDFPVIYIRNPALQTDYRIEYSPLHYSDVYEEESDD